MKSVNCKIAAVVTGVLTTGALMMPVSASAADYWHWSAKEKRWDHRADLRSDQQDLAEARRQLEYDRNHHANRRKIAEDEARVRDIEHEVHADRAAVRH
jgi:Spy/CpxP family protein refolding chaperone